MLSTYQNMPPAEARSLVGISLVVQRPQEGLAPTLKPVAWLARHVVDKRVAWMRVID